MNDKKETSIKISINELDSLEFLDKQDLIKMIKRMVNGGVTLMFHGKKTAQEIQRKVRPRVTRIVKNLCCGSPEDQSKNMIIEGENLQAMVTLYKYRGEVDLIVTVIFSLLEYCIHSIRYRTLVTIQCILK
jgi:adenine-specific DNA-methyltransferase